MEYAKNFDSSAEKMISKYIRKPQIIYGILILFIALYAAQIAPLVPLSVSKVFNNSYFKVCFMILVLWVAQVSPSLSILIAVLFLMVTNYANNKSLFEMLENTTAAPASESEPVTSTPPTPLDSVNAVNMLTIQAMTPEAGAVDEVTKAADIAVSTMAPSDEKGISSVAELAKQAAAPSAGDANTIATAMTDAVTAINNNIPATLTPVAVTQAVQTLAESAASPIANNVSAIQTAANIATAAVLPSTPATAAAISNIQALANASVTPAPTDQQTVTQATQAVMNAITGTPAPSTPEPAEAVTTSAPAPVEAVTTSAPAPVEAATTSAPVAAPTASSTSGCYPIRSVDMSKVQGEIEGAGIEDYQPFTPSM